MLVAIYVFGAGFLSCLTLFLVFLFVVANSGGRTLRLSDAFMDNGNAHVELERQLDGACAHSFAETPFHWKGKKTTLDKERIQ